MQEVEPETISRVSLIVALRNELAQRAKGEMSICKLAAEKGIFCRGFRHYSDADLKKSYGWIAKRYPNASRAELEAMADRWQMARQDVLEVPTSCDVQQLEHDACGGWEDFSNDELAGFLRDLTGREVVVA